MILVSMTYGEVTPESAEHGDCSDSGFVYNDQAFTFRELVDLMKEHKQASCSPATGEIYECYSSGFDTYDYRTCTEKETCIHYSRQNPGYKEKYWRKAAIVAGIVK